MAHTLNSMLATFCIDPPLGGRQPCLPHAKLNSSACRGDKWTPWPFAHRHWESKADNSARGFQLAVAIFVERVKDGKRPKLGGEPGDCAHVQVAQIEDDGVSKRAMWCAYTDAANIKTWTQETAQLYNAEKAFHTAYNAYASSTAPEEEKEKAQKAVEAVLKNLEDIEETLEQKNCRVEWKDPDGATPLKHSVVKGKDAKAALGPALEKDYMDHMLEHGKLKKDYNPNKSVGVFISLEHASGVEAVVHQFSKPGEPDPGLDPSKFNPHAILEEEIANVKNWPAGTEGQAERLNELERGLKNLADVRNTKGPMGNEYPITIERAEEPELYIWENLEINPHTRNCRKLIIMIFAAILLGAGVVMIVIANQWKDDMAVRHRCRLTCCILAPCRDYSVCPFAYRPLRRTACPNWQAY
eukprot:SAG11_NODE_327_length_10699_cov_4.828272_8_plen_413_part_00